MKPAREETDLLRPRDPASGDPLPPTARPGYFPGFSTLSQQAFWDAATRDRVLARVRHPPTLRFFTPDEAALMQLFADHLLPQFDRVPERRIPIVPWIDERLFTKRTPGYQFEEMPPDDEAYRLGFEAIERMARAAHGRGFIELDWHEQDVLLKSIHDAKPFEGGGDIWRRMPVHRYWALVLQDCIEAYYAHPWAWDEVGFGGPAYPRAYFRLENGQPEPWEVDERRYEWEAPAQAVSDPEEPEIAAHRGHPPHGQGGTH
jgi:hypothetical protein